jgi:hypothetical protein
METAILMGTACAPLVTLCVLTTSYCRCSNAVPQRKLLLAQSFRSGRPGFCRRFIATRVYPATVPQFSCGKGTPQIASDALTSPTQQRWADRPVYPLPIIIAALYPVLNLPLICFHRSAHRCCAGNLTVCSASSSAGPLSRKPAESAELNHVIPGGEEVEDARRQHLKSLCAPAEIPGEKPSECSAWSHGFFSALLVTTDTLPAKYWATTRELDDLRGSRLSHFYRARSLCGSTGPLLDRLVPRQ